MKKFIKYCLICLVGGVAMYLFLDMVLDGYIKELDAIAHYNQEYHKNMF